MDEKRKKQDDKNYGIMIILGILLFLVCGLIRYAFDSVTLASLIFLAGVFGIEYITSNLK
jgi:hypothetical protein